MVDREKLYSQKIDISKLATLVEGDPKPSFSIATKPREGVISETI